LALGGGCACGDRRYSFINCRPERQAQILQKTGQVEKNEMTETQRKIQEICCNLGNFLQKKNERYGDAALSPVSIFNKGDASSSITIRLDDKLSRIKNSDELRKNDVVDVAGYLVLLMAANGWINFDEFLD